MRVLERFDRAAKLHHLAASTTRCYRDWIVQFLTFHREGARWRHPRELRGPELAAFLTHLAADRLLSASSQNQAACAVVFLYKQVLGAELGPDHLGRFAGQRSQRPARVPTVLGVADVGGWQGKVPLPLGERVRQFNTIDRPRRAHVFGV